MKKYLFSVIIPIYNVEDYLEETIKSIISQSIGFKNIQLILVNDGSKDNSEVICQKYRKLYPENVIYLKQKNSGVSSARNNGLRYVEGEYVNFLDSDDLWEKNAFKKALSLFKKNKDICAVTFPLKFFEATKSEHPLNYLYKKTKIINIFEEPQYIKLSSCSTIFKYEVIKDQSFSSKLKIGEDIRLLTEIFFDNPKVGFISDCAYLYRKRKIGTSALQNSTQKPTWYLDTPKYCYEYLIDLSKEKFGKIIAYLQNILVYDIHWRMNIPVENCISEDDAKVYLKKIHNILKQIDDHIIFEFPLMNLEQKIYMLKFKYQNSMIFKIKDEYVYVEDSQLDLINNFNFYVDNVIINEDKVDIYGKYFPIKNVLENIYAKIGNENVLLETYELDKSNKYLKKIEEKYFTNRIGVHLSINLKKVDTLSFRTKRGNKFYDIKPFFSYSCQLDNKFDSLYLKTDNYFLKYDSKENILKKYNKNIRNKFLLELKCDVNLLKRGKFKSLIYRKCAKFYEIFKKKPIWLLSDRIQCGNDNGEALFNFLAKENPDIDFYFVINKNTETYKKLKNIFGKKIIIHKSFKHKILFLLSDKIISSHADDYVINLFGNGKKFLADLYRFKFIFLQHGITKDDLSPWLNVNNKKIDLFITAANSEYQSFINGKYRYNFPKENIKLTGFARFDKLKNKTKNNTILLMPTWRNGLVGTINIETGLREYDENFKNTDYFKFYNSLINDQRLLKTLKETKYSIKFIAHTNMKQQLDDFNKNDYVDIITDNVDYSFEFQNNKLLVTDYSSVFFDFGYLNKPVIYCQFDHDTFFEGAVYDKGYFSYEKDGFGPVYECLDDTVFGIIDMISNDCRLQKKYENRINKFYKYRDKNNCKRIYKAIIELDKKEN